MKFCPSELDKSSSARETKKDTESDDRQTLRYTGRIEPYQTID